MARSDLDRSHPPGRRCGHPVRLLALTPRSVGRCVDGKVPSARSASCRTGSRAPPQFGPVHPIDPPGERGRALLRRLSRWRVLGHHSSLGGMLPARFSPTSGQLSHRVWGKTLPCSDVRVFFPSSAPPEFLCTGALTVPTAFLNRWPKRALPKACFEWLGHCWEGEVTLRLLHDRMSFSHRDRPGLFRSWGHRFRWQAVASPVPSRHRKRGGTIDAKLSPH